MCWRRYAIVVGFLVENSSGFVVENMVANTALGSTNESLVGVWVVAGCGSSWVNFTMLEQRPGGGLVVTRKNPFYNADLIFLPSCGLGLRVLQVPEDLIIMPNQVICAYSHDPHLAQDLALTICCVATTGAWHIIYSELYKNVNIVLKIKTLIQFQFNSNSLVIQKT